MEADAVVSKLEEADLSMTLLLWLRGIDEEDERLGTEVNQTVTLCPNPDDNLHLTAVVLIQAIPASDVPSANLHLPEMWEKHRPRTVVLVEAVTGVFEPAASAPKDTA